MLCLNYTLCTRCVYMFVQFASMLDRLASYCAERGLATLRMDGETPVQDRIIFMRSFKNDASIRVSPHMHSRAGHHADSIVIFYRR